MSQLQIRGSLPLHVPTLLALALGIVACGGDSSPTTPAPTPAPTPPPPIVVLDGTGPIPTCGENCTLVVFDPFITDATGTIDATVDYTYEESLISVWIASGVCEFEQFVTGQCQFAAVNFSGKPVRASATSQPAGTYTLIIGNGGPRDESVSFQVVFTAQASAATTPGPVTSASKGLSSDRLVHGGSLRH